MSVRVTPRQVTRTVGFTAVAFGAFSVFVVNANHLSVDNRAVIGSSRIDTDVLGRTLTRLASDDVLFDSNRSGGFQIFAMAADGTNLRQLTLDDSTDAWWPRRSPDRQHILYYRSPLGTHDTDYTKAELWVMDSDGSNPRLLRGVGNDGWAIQGHAEWSPTGDSLVMFGGSVTNPQIYITDTEGKNPRPVTARGGGNIDPSFSPDGSSVAFIGCPRRACTPNDYEVYVARPADGALRRLTDDNLRDHHPAFSPDGSSIAWATEIAPAGPNQPIPVWDVRLIPSAGGEPRRLYNDANLTNRPVWETNKSLLVHRLELGVDLGYQVFRVGADGTGSERLTTGPNVNEYPG